MNHSRGNVQSGSSRRGLGGSTHDNLLELREIFNRIDSDKGGTINKDELFNIVQSLGLAFTEKDAEDMVNNIDVNGNGEIDFYEFSNAIEQTLDIPFSKDEMRQAFEVFRSSDCPLGKIHYDDLLEILMSFGSLAEIYSTIHTAEASVNALGGINIRRSRARRKNLGESLSAATGLSTVTAGFSDGYPSRSTKRSPHNTFGATGSGTPNALGTRSHGDASRGLSSAFNTDGAEGFPNSPMRSIGLNRDILNPSSTARNLSPTGGGFKKTPGGSAAHSPNAAVSTADQSSPAPSPHPSSTHSGEVTPLSSGRMQSEEHHDETDPAESSMSKLKKKIPQGKFDEKRHRTKLVVSKIANTARLASTSTSALNTALDTAKTAGLLPENFDYSMTRERAHSILRQLKVDKDGYVDYVSFLTLMLGP